MECNVVQMVRYLDFGKFVHGFNLKSAKECEQKRMKMAKELPDPLKTYTSCHVVKSTSWL